MQAAASKVWDRIAEQASEVKTVRIDDQLGLDIEQAHESAEHIGSELGWTDVTMSSLIHCEQDEQIIAVYRDAGDYYTMEYVEDRQIIVIRQRSLTDIIEHLHGGVERRMDQVIDRECE
jgi:hypothetical protein